MCIRQTTGFSVLLITAFAFSLALPNPAHATKFWKNGVTNGNWNVAANWSTISASDTTTSGVPIAGEDVNIVNADGVAHTVTYDVNAPTLRLLTVNQIGAGAAVNTLSISSNNNLTVQAMFVGGWTGGAFGSATIGRGAVNQSNGTVSMVAGTDFVLGHGAGSTGTYTLSGGSLTAPQSEFIGSSGTGSFNHSGGTNTILAGAIGYFNVGTSAGGIGNYNLSGTGVLTSNKSEYIGDAGTATFTQSGGTNTIQGASNHLYLGNVAGSSGTYNISAGTLTANNDVNVGVNGTGSLNISGTGSVFVGSNLAINGTSNVTLNGGTLRLNTTNAPNRITFSSGKLQLGGSRTIGTDPIVTAQFGANPVIPSGKELAIDGDITIAASLNVNGGKLSTVTGSGGGLSIGTSGTKTLSITNGGTALISLSTLISAGSTINVDGVGSQFTSSVGDINVGGSNTSGNINISGGASMTAGGGARVGGTFPGATGQGFVTVTGSGSTWTLGLSLFVGGDAPGTLTIQDNGLVSAGTAGLEVFNNGVVNLNGGTLRTPDISVSGSGKFVFNAGTIVFTGDRSIGSDVDIATYYGGSPVVATGKGLGVEGTATLLTPFLIDGGTLSVGQLANGSNLTLNRGKLNITNQALTIGSGGQLGSTLDLNDDMTINVTLGTTNQGLVTGDGEIGGTFTNAATGELRGEPGKSLKLTGASNTNAGQINLLGGLVEYTQGLTNNVGGFISGNGTLRVGTLLTNNGTMNFSGLANIVGDVTNNAGGKIISSGGGPTTFFDDVTNNGEIRTTAGSFTVFYGAAAGSGTYTGLGTVNFEGDLKPGNSPAAVHFDGDVVLGTASTLRMELGGSIVGSQYDQINVAGKLTLGGTLEVTLINGFVPSAGQTFDLLNWGTVAGAFASLQLPSVPGLAWNTSQLSSGIVSIVSAGIPGDYNNNGAVDAADYVVWRNSLGQNVTLPNDTTPGAVSQADYDVWRANLGQTAGSGAGSSLDALGTAVPEPAGGIPLFVAAVGLLGNCRRSTRRLKFFARA